MLVMGSVEFRTASSLIHLFWVIASETVRQGGGGGGGGGGGAKTFLR